MIIGIANNILGKYGRGSGAEVIAEKMATNYKEQGHEVFIITTKPKQQKNKNDHDNDYYYLPSNYSYLKDWTTPRKLLWYLQQILFPENCQQIKKILETRKPDLFITHNLIGLGFCLPRLLKKYNIRHEHVLHDIQLLHPSGLMYYGKENIINSLPAKIYQLFTKNLLKNADLIISPSHWLLELHRKKGFFINQNTEVRLNFNLKKISPPPLKKPINFVFLGQIEKHKGIDILISAWKQANLSPETAKLTIAGNGSLSTWLKESIVSVNNINYLGHLDRNDIKLLLEKSDVVIVPSLVYENSPTSLWEAAIFGKRAIASNIGGIPELSPYLDLLLVPPGNINNLKEAIKKMIK